MKKMMTAMIAVAVAFAIAGCCTCGGDKACACTDGKACVCGDKCNCAKEKVCACDNGKACTCCTDHAKCACKKPGCSCKK